MVSETCVERSTCWNSFDKASSFLTMSSPRPLLRPLAIIPQAEGNYVEPAHLSESPMALVNFDHPFAIRNR